MLEHEHEQDERFGVFRGMLNVALCWAIVAGGLWLLRALRALWG